MCAMCLSAYLLTLSRCSILRRTTFDTTLPFMRKKILFVVSLLFGLMFLNAGLNKFFNYMPPPKEMPAAMMQMFTGMTQISWLIPLIAVAEIVGGILFITNKYRALGALIIFPVMIGIMSSSGAG